MTLLHPASAGSAVSVWFVDGEPVRLRSSGVLFRVTGEPRCADINGQRYWRVRARGGDGSTATFDLRQHGDGWVLAGVDDDSLRAGSR
jgi:hypothetical protein